MLIYFTICCKNQWRWISCLVTNLTVKGLKMKTWHYFHNRFDLLKVMNSKKEPR